MAIYLVERTDEVDKDQYDSFIIAAKSPIEAFELAVKRACGRGFMNGNGVVVKELDPQMKSGIILGSYNAG